MPYVKILEPVRAQAHQRSVLGGLGTAACARGNAGRSVDIEGHRLQLLQPARLRSSLDTTVTSSLDRVKGFKASDSDF